MPASSISRIMSSSELFCTDSGMFMPILRKKGAHAPGVNCLANSPHMGRILVSMIMATAS